MNADELLRELQSRALTVLAVTEHSRDPDVLVVFLDGYSCQWVDGLALRRVANVPGVLSVTESPIARTILLARIEREPDSGPDSEAANDA